MGMIQGYEATIWLNDSRIQGYKVEYCYDARWWCYNTSIILKIREFEVTIRLYDRTYDSMILEYEVIVLLYVRIQGVGTMIRPLWR